MLIFSFLFFLSLISIFVKFFPGLLAERRFQNDGRFDEKKRKRENHEGG